VIYYSVAVFLILNSVIVTEYNFLLVTDATEIQINDKAVTFSARLLRHTIYHYEYPKQSLF
jgi:hypothetical protein